MPNENATAPDDAAALVERAREYVTRLFLHVAPQCEPEPDLYGVLTQLDNAIVGLMADRAALAAARAHEGQAEGGDGVALLRAAFAHAEKAAAQFTAPEIRLPIRNAANALDVALARALAALRPAPDGAPEPR